METADVEPDGLDNLLEFGFGTDPNANDNVTAMQLTPAGLTEIIREHVPGFEIDYAVDPVRQAIAESWPDRIDDSAARAEWDWSPKYDASEPE